MEEQCESVAGASFKGLAFVYACFGIVVALIYNHLVNVSDHISLGTHALLVVSIVLMVRAAIFAMRSGRYKPNPYVHIIHPTGSLIVLLVFIYNARLASDTVVLMGLNAVCFGCLAIAHFSIRDSRSVFIYYGLTITAILILLALKQSSLVWMGGTMSLLCLAALGKLFYLAQEDITQAIQIRFRAEQSFERTRSQRDYQMKLAATDALTGMDNRRAFIGSLSQWVSQADINTRRLMLIMVDVDKFKTINDSYGHLAGDQVLIQVGEFLVNRSEKHGRAARLGGDEFIMYLELSESDDPQSILTNLAVEMPSEVADGNIYIPNACSIGAYVVEMADVSVSDIMSYADYALYIAKQVTGTHSHLFSSEDMARVQSAKSAMARIQDDIAQKRIVSHYQMMVPVGGAPVMPIVEALLRLKRPDGTFLPPLDCMQAVTRLGLTSEFTYQQLTQCLRDVLASPIDLMLAYNLSPSQLSDPNLLTVIELALRKIKFPPERLILEISELTLQSQVADAKTTVETLRAQGIKIAIDDFGAANTGYHMFRDLKVDFIKADKSLLSDDSDPELNVVILRQMAEFCRLMSIKSICEGVESQGGFDQGRVNAFDYAQGYFISEPSELPQQLDVLTGLNIAQPNLVRLKDRRVS